MFPRLAALVLFLVTSLPATAEDKSPDKIETLYKTLQMTVEKGPGQGPFKVGDDIKVTFGLKNAGKVELVPPTRVVSVDGKMSEDRSIGVVQHWVERLGNNADIPAIPAKIGRDGKRYAAGGWVIIPPSPIKAGAAVPLVLGGRGAITNTKDYPAGKYRITAEWKGLDNKVIQSESVEFELK